MLASELAQELGTDPSVISKRLGIYRAETGTPQNRVLDAETVGHMREAHRLLTSGKVTTFRAAVQQLTGRYVEPIPPQSAQAILARLDALEAGQARLLGVLEQIAGDLRWQVLGALEEPGTLPAGPEQG